jgi:hypothetical protein
VILGDPDDPDVVLALSYMLTQCSQFIAHLYRVGGREWFNGSGSVTIDGTTPISAIGFAGKNTVPDSGSTLMLLGIAVPAVIFLKRRICTLTM